MMCSTEYFTSQKADKLKRRCSRRIRDCAHNKLHKLHKAYKLVRLGWRGDS